MFIWGYCAHPYGVPRLGRMSTQSTPTGWYVYQFGLGDRLRAAREQAGHTAAEFALVAGISRNTIAAYESGRTPAPRKAILAWALATGFDSHWLETGVETGLDSDPTTRHARTGVVVRHLALAA